MVWIKSGALSFAFDKTKTLGMITPQWTFPVGGQRARAHNDLLSHPRAGEHLDLVAGAAVLSSPAKESRNHLARKSSPNQAVVLFTSSQEKMIRSPAFAAPRYARLPLIQTLSPARSISWCFEIRDRDALGKGRRRRLARNEKPTSHTGFVSARAAFGTSAQWSSSDQRGRRFKNNWDSTSPAAYLAGLGTTVQ